MPACYKQTLLRLIAIACIALNALYVTADEEDKLSINMRDADISAVIQWVAESSNKKIVVDPRVKGKVTVLANSAMSADEVYDVFLAMLDVYGFAATENNGILRIFPAALAKQSPAAVVEAYSALGGGEQVLYVFQAKNVSASKLSSLLQPLIPTSGYIGTLENTNMLVIADDSANVKRLVSLVQQIDSSGDFGIDIVRLEYAQADKVAELVNSLAKGSDDASFSAASDMRSNSLLMTGDSVTKARALRLVKQLDHPLETAGVTRVVHLNYLSADEAVTVLKGTTAALQKEQSQGSAEQSPISIESSSSTNTIIMTGAPPMLDVMSDVIKQLDVRQSQVLVEAIIVEVSEDFSEALGVEWNTNLSQDDNVEAITNFGLRTVDSDGEIALLNAGLNLGLFRNGSLRALVTALASENDANILSTPSILTIENQEAEILVGANVPFITGQTTSESSSTTNPFTTITREDIGLTLRITPQINNDKSITLDVLQEVETITDSTTVASDIVTNKRSIKTKVIVQDNSVLVLGGLISDEEQLIERKVPLLGDIPLLGTLFKSTNQNLVKRNLMVFIHPTIIDESNDKTITEQRYSKMQSLQKEYIEGNSDLEREQLKDFTEFTPQQSQSK